MIFENYELEEIVKCKLNKFEVTKDDLDKIDEITINSKTITGKNITNSLIDLIKFKNLIKVSIFGFEIDKENAKIINSLKNIKSIEFYDCIILDEVYIYAENIKLSRVENISNLLLKNVNYIEMSNLNMNNFNYSYLKKSEKIIFDDVIGFNETNIDVFKMCKFLSLKNMELVNLNKVEKMKKLEKISLLSCKLDDKSYIDNLANTNKNINVNFGVDYLLDSKLGDKNEN